MASQTRSAGAGAGISVGSEIRFWVNPGNITVSDDTYAVQNEPHATATLNQYLAATDFGFTIPSGATIDGIEVAIEKMNGGGGTSVRDNVVQLVLTAGSGVGDNKADTATDWSETGFDAITTYGGAADTWASGFDVDDINSTGFGVWLRAAGNAQAWVDHIGITVYYTESGGGPTVTVSGAAGCCGSVGDIAGGC